MSNNKNNNVKIIVIINDDMYIFKKNNNKIIVNNDVLILDPNLISDEDEKTECLEIYNSLIEEGYSVNYSLCKSALTYATYTEVGYSPPIELMDTIVLYLLGIMECENLKSDMNIIINDEEVYIKNSSERYYQPTTGSSCISYNYDVLLETLIKEHNRNYNKNKK